MLVKVPGGWRIKSHVTGKLYPKVYASEEEGNARIDQMEAFKEMKKSIPILSIDQLYDLKKGRGPDKQPRKKRAATRRKKDSKPKILDQYGYDFSKLF